MARPAFAQNATPSVVIIGGGFGGSTCARELKRLDSHLKVSLIESDRRYAACPSSNAVIAGLRDFEAQEFGYEALVPAGIDLHFATAIGVDSTARRITLSDGSTVSYDRLVLAPGIDIRWGALPGYTEQAADRMPHAWKAGPQTMLLRRQLEAMKDGGLVVMSVPANPIRCPTAAYERASLIAHYLKTSKPKSKLIVLDAKDSFSMQRLFQAAWRELYPGLLEWLALSEDGRVASVEPDTNTFVTDFDRHRADVANVIPPQQAGRIAALAGVADRTGWCPIDPVTFESRLQPSMHVIGDAATTGAMAKSAFAAHGQAKVCANAIVALLRGDRPQPSKLINTCYSLVAPDYAISVAGVYAPVDGQLMDVEGAGGVSPLEASADFRAREAAYAEAWFRTITRDVFG